MHLKKYEVNSITEAMERIKSDLGADAIILSSRRIGTGRSSKIEIVAAVDRPGEAIGVEQSDSRQHRLWRENTETTRENNDRWNRIDARFDEMNENICALMASLAGAGEDGKFGLSPLCRMLVSRGISPGCAFGLERLLKEEARDGNPAAEEDQSKRLEQVISRAIRDACAKGTRNRRIAAFIGPAGEGKTTTLAKIAANLRYREKQTLGIVTMDTFRIGAVEQLKIYGDIMDVPVETFSEGDSLEKILQKFSHLDRVLIDTPGKSRTDKDHLARLREYFCGEIPVETNLVLSATTGSGAMMDAARRFLLIDYEHIIVTKVDDARDLGCIFNVIDLTKRPVSHITHGQQVPRDIRAMDSEGIAQLIMEQTARCH